MNSSARRPLVVTALPLSAVFGLLSAVDVLAFSPAPVSSALKVFALASLAGAAVGGLLALLFHALSPLPNVIWRSFWCLVGFIYAAMLASELGAFEAIGGKHTALGIVAIVASSALGIYLVILACVFQPSRERTQSWVAKLRPRYRAFVLIVLLGVCVALLVVDAFGFPLTYPAAHTALRWGAMLSAGAFVFLAIEAQRPSLRRLRLMQGTLALLVLISFPIALSVDEEERAELNTWLGRPIAGFCIGVLRQATDVDFDGYSALVGGGDCAAFSPSVNPGANEIPGNGIDENCMGGDAQSRFEVESPGAPLSGAPSPVSVVLISIDTVAVDHTSLYGYERETTPRLEKWARSALRFDRAYTSGPWTALAMSSLFRGVYPRRLQWSFVWETNRWRLLRTPVKAGDLRNGERKRSVFAMPVDDPLRTLPEWLALRGMRTEAVVNDGESQFLAKELGATGEWNKYTMASLHGKRRYDASATYLAKRRLRSLAKGGPFLLWVHYFGPHDPPRKEAGKPRWGTTTIDLYDHHLRYTDRQVGSLLDAIDAVEHEHPIAVILTADHGEEFQAGHRGHGGNLKDANVRIPLLVRGPGFTNGVSKAVVSLVDILPTILTWTRSPLPAGLDGKPLQTIVAEAPPKPRTVLSETWRFNNGMQVYMDKIAAITDGLKLEWDLLNANKELRHIGSDGRERATNLITSLDSRQLEAAITQYLERNRRVTVKD